MKKLIVLDYLRELSESAKAYIDALSLKIATLVSQTFAEIQESLLPSGGSDGQILRKVSDEDYEVDWSGYLCNRDMLYNSFWVNTINRLNINSYTLGTNLDYAMDGWCGKDLNVNVEIDHVGILWNGLTGTYGFIAQKIEDYLGMAGQICTFSALIDDELIYVSGRFPSTSESAPVSSGFSFLNGSTCLEISFESGERYPFVQVQTNSRTQKRIKALKLELGSIQTLGHKENENWVLNSIPDRVSDLRRCQRYFLPFTEGEEHASLRKTSNTIDFFIPTPVTMSRIPDIVGPASANFSIEYGEKSSGAHLSWSIVTLAENGVVLRGTGNHGVEYSNDVFLIVNHTDEVIGLDARL